MTRRTLEVLLVRDGRPGHEKQSLGLIASLKKRYTVRLQEVRVQPGCRAVYKAASFMWGRLSQELSDFAPDLIIGTGSHTHLPMLALQKRLGGRTVVCMSPMSLIRPHFDLCCIPRHDEIPAGNNVLLTDGPPGVNSDLGRHNPSSILVLVGGVDEKSHVWDNEAIAKSIVSAVARHSGVSWTLTTSPRTPSNFLEVFAKQQRDARIALYPFRQTPPGWLEKELQVASWVLVTEDSLSMIFEALSAGCQVATIPVAFKTDNKFVRCLHDLKNRNLIASELLSTPKSQSAVLNEAERCVGHMQQQPWWLVP